MATGDEWEENREHVGRNETRLSPDFHLSSRCRNYDFWRMPPRVQTSLGADANVAGSRFGCRSSQMRVWLVLDALTGIGNETAARVPQFSAYALRGRPKTYCFRTPP